MDNKKLIMISEPTLRRLPLYYHFLSKKWDEGYKNISGTAIADRFHFVSIQVRKDLQMTGAVGKPRVGYDIETTMECIADVLDYHNSSDAFLVGVGNIGKALLSFHGFEQNGLHIVGAFDNDESLIGTEINGVKILSITKLESLIRRMNIKIGIIATPEIVANDIADIMARADIKGIWSFAPGRLNVPDNIVVKYENLVTSLSILKSKIANKI